MDPRIWEPDETCEPFHLETRDASLSDGNNIFYFSIPSLHLGVITHVITFTSLNINKQGTNIVFGEGFLPASGAGGGAPSMPISGALLNVREWATGAEIRSIVGLICPGIGPRERPVRIILREGDWTVSHQGASIILPAPFWVHGYIFPLR